MIFELRNFQCKAYDSSSHSSALVRNSDNVSVSCECDLVWNADACWKSEVPYIAKTSPRLHVSTSRFRPHRIWHYSLPQHLHRHVAPPSRRSTAAWLPLLKIEANLPPPPSIHIHNIPILRLSNLPPRIPPPILSPPLHYPSALCSSLSHLCFPHLARDHRHRPSSRPHSRFPLRQLAPALDCRGRNGQSWRGEVRAVFEEEGLG